MKTLAQLNLTPTDRHAITGAADLLCSRLPVATILLYGSKARGDATPDSDIDLLILTTRPLTAAERGDVIDILYPLQLQLGVLFSTIEVPENEWRHGVYQAMPLYREVARDGAEVLPTARTAA